MMKLRINNCLLVLLYIVLASSANAQHFNYEVELNPVKTTGFYSIPVLPDLSAHMQLDFSDVRIWDEKEKQVPYIIRSRKPKWQAGLFHSFTIVENKLNDSGYSEIIVQKDVISSIASLSFIIRNAAVSRYASLSGSANGKTWFIISENILINDSYETDADSSLQSITFPPSSYTFFRLVIDNKKSDPLNISSVGYYSNIEHSTADPYIKNPEVAFKQIDSSNGFSYIHAVKNKAFPVNQLSFIIDGPKYYTRPFTVMISTTDKRGRSYWNEIASFNVSATNQFQIAVPAFKEREFYVTIFNGDNPPLKIISLATAQEYHELVTWLDAGKKYKIVMDATNTVAPHYDLQQFADSIPDTVPEAIIQKLQPRQTIDSNENTDHFPRKYIWLIMIGAVALLSLLTWRLTTEMRKSKDTPTP